jgi:hypothetical protein
MKKRYNFIKDHLIIIIKLNVIESGYIDVTIINDRINNGILNFFGHL